MNELTLAYRRLTKGNHDSAEVLAYRGVEIEFAPELILIHSNDIFVSDLFLLQETISFVHFSVGAHHSGELLFYLHELLLVRYCV